MLLVVRMPAAELLDVNDAVRASDYSFTTPEFTGKVVMYEKSIDAFMPLAGGRSGCLDGGIRS